MSVEYLRLKTAATRADLEDALIDCRNALSVTVGNIRHVWNDGSDERVWAPYRVWLDVAEQALASADATLEKVAEDL